MLAELIDRQSLLFNRTTPVTSNFVVDSDDISVRRFALDGFDLVDGLPDIFAALAYLERYLGLYLRQYASVHDPFASEIRLAKVDRIPVCSPAISESFQALHFDMGLPLDPDLAAGSSLFNFAALYVPYNVVNPHASTRLLPLRRLSLSPDRALASKLDVYVKEYGDGWAKPSYVNTGRLGSLARVLDSLNAEPQLTDYYNKAVWEWFNEIPSEDGLIEYQREAEFFRQFEIDIETLEDRVQLVPGQLLIIDNISCVHGRVGRRQFEEVYQVLYGSPSVSQTQIIHIKDHLVASMESSRQKNESKQRYGFAV
ncbi:MAG: hypothetical protein JSS79_11340 [Bacteroidetes bacterium]|nr:hypothetical protein [Bacteroidota bacterium]